MTPAAPPTSSRLLRAVDAERAELDRHRDRLVEARERLRAELAGVEAGLAAVDERLLLLERLAPPAAQGDGGVARPASGAEPVPLRRELASAVEPRTILRGTAIRETAVRLLRARRDDGEAVHYRDWFEMLTAEGYTVAGKDPLAVFLTQVSRSPVVRRSTQAGVYELDAAAPARLRRELDDLHEQLRAVAGPPRDAADLAAVRARRRELTAAIGQVEKALEEAGRLMGPEPAAAELAGVDAA